MAAHGLSTIRSIEVDLIIEHAAKLYPMEIKLTATPGSGHAQRLLKWRDLAGSKVPATVVHNGDKVLTLGPDVTAIPIRVL